MIEKKDVYFQKGDFLIDGTTYLVPPNEEFGYKCGFAVFVPKNCDKDTTLIMHSCNTGGNVPVHLDEANEIARKSTYEKYGPGMWLGSDLNMPVMTPLIPRVQYYYTQALGSRVYKNDISHLRNVQMRKDEEDRLSEEELMRIQEQCRDIPEQVVNMLPSAKELLRTLGITIDDKVILEGYSAGSKFANCFMALHPEVVKALVVGGNSGLGIVPLSEYQGEALNFPLGVADIPNFNYDEFISIPQLYYIGTEDYNDPAMYKCNFVKDANGNFAFDEEGRLIPVVDKNGDIIPILDSNGRLQPRYEENYTQEEIEQIHKLLGKNPQVRFNTNESIYNELGVNATFKRFPGTHQTVTQKGDGNYIYTNECVKDFIKSVVGKNITLENEDNILK